MAYDPFFSTNPVVETIEAHRGKVEQIRENTARLASAYATYSTEGDGEFLLDEPHLFGCTFTERPIVAYGFSMGDSDNEDQLVIGKLPTANGGVRRWVTDVRGFYIGAYVFFTVDTATVARTTAPTGAEDPPSLFSPPDPNAATPLYRVDHDFTFTGIALKDLPEYLLDPTSEPLARDIVPNIINAVGIQDRFLGGLTWAWDAEGVFDEFEIKVYEALMGSGGMVRGELLQTLRGPAGTFVGSTFAVSFHGHTYVNGSVFAGYADLFGYIAGVKVDEETSLLATVAFAS